MPTPPAAITEAVEFAQKRIGRVAERETAVAHEKCMAAAALEAAQARLAAWREANPEPQMDLL
jgi:hypothetical protein